MYYITLITLAFFALGFLFKRKLPLLIHVNFLRDYVSSVEDQWTWTTDDGCCYENVEVKSIEGDEIVLDHKFGTVRLLIGSLSHESQQRLVQHFGVVKMAVKSVPDLDSALLAERESATAGRQAA